MGRTKVLIGSIAVVLMAMGACIQGQGDALFVSRDAQDMGDLAGEGAEISPTPDIADLLDDGHCRDMADTALDVGPDGTSMDIRDAADQEASDGPADVFRPDFSLPPVGIVCTSDVDCTWALPPRDGCEMSLCLDGYCQHMGIAGCCNDDSACPDWDPCTDDRCELTACLHEMSADPHCCAGDSLLALDFEDPAEWAGYQTQSEDRTGRVFWHRSSEYHTSGVWSLAFADPLGRTYDTGWPVAGEWRGPALTLPIARPTVLRFDLLLDTEWRYFEDSWADPSPFVYDRLTLALEDGTEQRPIWSSYSMDVQGSTCDAFQCTFLPVAVALPEFAGRTVQPVFRFDSGDGIDNTYAGAYIDHFELREVCGPQPACYGSVDCEDGDLCTLDRCVAGACTHEPSYLSGCCYDYPYVTYDFEGGSWQGFEAPEAAPAVRWQPSTLQAHAGQWSLYFGDIATGGYDDPGNQVEGTVRSSAYPLPYYTLLDLRFWLFLDVAEPTRDVFWVALIDETAGQVTALFDSTALTLNDFGRWHEVALPVGAWAAHNVRVELRFDSINSFNNVGQGVFVDEVRFMRVCP